MDVEGGLGLLGVVEPPGVDGVLGVDGVEGVDGVLPPGLPPPAA